MDIPQMPSATGYPYTPAGGNNMPTAPHLGTPVPGTTGGLPQKPGLSVFDNPTPSQFQSQPNNPAQTAQQTQSFGRGQDSVLVHMTPNEVNSLRGLAQQFGGDLTQNPHTGLPEAGFLGKLLPTLLGGLGMAFGIPPVWMGALGLAGGTAATGSLTKGLQMGLGAFGGASLAGGLGLGAAGAASSAPAAGISTSLTGAGSSAIAPAVANAATTGAAAAGGGGGLLGQFGTNFANAAKTGLGTGIASKAAVPLATAGLMGTASSALTPSVKPTKEKPSEYGYTGPYRLSEERKSIMDPNATRNAAGVLTTPEGKMTSGEQLYFKPTTSYVDSSGAEWTPGQKTTPVSEVKSGKGGKNTRYIYEKDLEKYMAEQEAKRQKGGFGMAEGGEVFHMESGGHVFPAKAVAAYGNFNTEAGQEKLARMGGIPIRGDGDGVSDSIPAMIDGSQDAAVANGEVYFPPRAVKRLGGNDKLYAMMRGAERAANKTKSGEKVRGLGALR